MAISIKVLYVYCHVILASETSVFKALRPFIDVSLLSACTLSQLLIFQSGPLSSEH